MSDGFWDGSSTDSRLDIPAFFDSDFTAQVAAVLDLGALVSLGLTRDGGALGVAVFDDGRRRREYFRTSEEASHFLRGAVETLSGNGLGPPAAARLRSQKPTRGA